MSAFVSPVTVPAHEEVGDAALRAEMERLSSHIRALMLTHGHLAAQLDEAQRGAEDVQKQLAPGKREHARDKEERVGKGRAREEDDEYDDSLLHGLGAMGVGSSSPTAISVATAAAAAEVCVDSSPLIYRSAGFSTPTTGEYAADEFDGAAIEDAQQVTYRSCPPHASDPIVDMAVVEEAVVSDRAALCAAVAGLGALAKPDRPVARSVASRGAAAGLPGLVVSDAAVEQQLEKLAMAMRAFLAV